MTDTLNLRDALPAAEAVSPELEQRYRERLRALLERPVSAGERVFHAIGGIIALGTVARCVQLFLLHRADGRPIGIVGLALAIAFSLAWVGVSAEVVRSGSDRVFGNRRLRSVLIAVFAFLVAAVSLWAGLGAEDATRRQQLVAFGLGFWALIGLPTLVTMLVQEASVRTRMDLLRMEVAQEEARRAGTPRG